MRRGLCVALMVMGAFATPVQAASALSFPTAEQVIDRVRTTIRHTDLTSVDMVIKFRIGKPVTAPPECEFRGVLRIWPDRLALTVNQWTPVLMCWLIERYVLGRLFEDRDRAESLLPLFRFGVIGGKLVDGRPFYLLYGRAVAPETDPRWLIGWVDYDRGLVVDGTVRYAWGEISSVQEYGLVAGVWVPLHQVLDVPRFSASLDISYSGFRFVFGSRGLPSATGGYRAYRWSRGRAIPSGVGGDRGTPDRVPHMSRLCLAGLDLDGAILRYDREERVACGECH